MTMPKSTIGTHVYGADDPGSAAVKTIYVQRGGLPQPPPKTIKVTVEYDE